MGLKKYRNPEDELSVGYVNTEVIAAEDIHQKSLSNFTVAILANAVGRPDITWKIEMEENIPIGTFERKEAE
jgi:hypothetical protein